jgi:hypothetical protein
MCTASLDQRRLLSWIDVSILQGCRALMSDYPMNGLQGFGRLLAEMDENDVEMIKQVLHSYKRGEIEGDDLIHELSERLDPKVAVVM